MGKLTKRNILWVIPIGILITFFFVFGPKAEINDHQAINYVKTVTLPDYDKALGQLERICTDGKWIYFETSKNQAVVEFQGQCEETAIKQQFLVDDKRTNVRVGAMIKESKEASSEERDQFLQQLLQF